MCVCVCEGVKKCCTMASRSNLHFRVGRMKARICVGGGLEFAPTPIYICIYMYIASQRIAVKLWKFYFGLFGRPGPIIVGSLTPKLAQRI